MIIDFTLGKNGELAINDGNRRRILFYTDDDRFILTYPYPNDLEPRNIEYLNDSLLVLQSDVSGKNEFDLINPNSNILLNSYSPIKPAYISAASHGRYVRYNGKLLWHEPLNNNICELTADSAKIRYTIDVDGRTPPQDFWLKDTARKEKKEWTELIREHRQKGYIDNIMFFSETDETILLRFSGQNDTFDGTYALVDKETRQSTVIDMINFDGSFLWNPKQMYAQADGWIIIPIPPDLLLQEPQGDIAKQFPGLQPDDNPILCVAKLR
jgi:hypothetical protein